MTKIQTMALALKVIEDMELPLGVYCETLDEVRNTLGISEKEYDASLDSRWGPTDYELEKMNTN